MEAGIVIAFLVAGMTGWYGAPLLTQWGRRLLAAVPAEEAAPVALGEDTLGVLPLALTAPWPGILRVTLTIGLMFVVWRTWTIVDIAVSQRALIAATLASCIAIWLFVAVLDGATHLIFGSVLLIPVGLATISAMFGGMTATAWSTMFLGALIAGGATFALYLLGRLLYGTDALGFGDVQIAATIGFVLGWPLALSAIFWGCLALGGVALLLIITRRMTRQTYLPLGLFLIGGAILAICLQLPPWL